MMTLLALFVLSATPAFGQEAEPVPMTIPTAEDFICVGRIKSDTDAGLRTPADELPPEQAACFERVVSLRAACVLILAREEVIAMAGADGGFFATVDILAQLREPTHRDHDQLGTIIGLLRDAGAAARAHLATRASYGHRVDSRWYPLLDAVDTLDSSRPSEEMIESIINKARPLSDALDERARQRIVTLHADIEDQQKRFPFVRPIEVEDCVELMGYPSPPIP